MPGRWSEIKAFWVPVPRRGPGAASKLGVQPSGEDRYRPAVGIIGRVGDELVIEGQAHDVEQRDRIIGLQDPLGAVIEPAVADQDAEAAGRDEVAVIPRQAVDGGTDAHRIIGPAPGRALDRRAEREALVDVGEGHDLVAGVVPGPAPEPADIASDPLLAGEDT